MVKPLHIVVCKCSGNKMMWIGQKRGRKNGDKNVSKSIRAAEFFNDLSPVLNLIFQMPDLAQEA